MPLAKLIFFALLVAFALAFAAAWAAALSRRRQWQRPKVVEGLIGFFTEFFDALGIGSFATTTALYRLKDVVPDEKIPGTLNVGHCLPTFVQAIVFAEAVAVDPATLISIVAASVVGAWLGAGIVARMPRRQIQVGMGVALLIAAGLLVAKIYGYFPAGGDAVGLEGGKLMVAVLAALVIGAIMTIGVGAYAPIMILVALLGMNPKAAWPIMTGACALLMPVCGVRFIQADAYAPRAALGLTLWGIPGVLVAAKIVKELPLETVRWLVLVVVVYTAASILLTARRERQLVAASGNE